MALEAGEALLGRFRIERYRGAVGAVQLAEGRDRLGERVVLAVLVAPLGLVAGADAAELFGQCRRFALGVPRLARPIAAGIAEGRLVLAWEAGGERRLDELLVAEPPPERQWADGWLGQLAETLGRLHDGGSSHGWVVPELIAVRAGEATLEGFGLVDVARRLYGQEALAKLLPGAPGGHTTAEAGPQADASALAALERALRGGSAAAERTSTAPGEPPLVVEPRDGAPPAALPRDPSRPGDALRETRAAPAPAAAARPPRPAWPLVLGVLALVLVGGAGGLGVVVALLQSGRAGGGASAGASSAPVQGSPGQPPEPLEEGEGEGAPVAPGEPPLTEPNDPAEPPSATPAAPGGDAWLTADGPATAPGLVRAGDEARLAPPNSSESAALLPLRAGAALLGPAASPLTLVVFGDLDCPATRRLWRELGRLRGTPEAGLRVSWRHRPLSQHPNAVAAARVALALLEREPLAHYRFLDAVAASTEPADREQLERWVEQVGLAPGVVAAWLATPSDQVERWLAEDLLLAGRYAVLATPTLFVNGLRLDGFVGTEALARLLEQEGRAAARAAPRARGALYAQRVSNNLIGLEGPGAEPAPP